jgi:hypothetical protein
MKVCNFFLILCSLLLVSACSGGSSAITNRANTQEIAVPVYPFNTVSADFNKDNWQDIAVISKNGMLRVFMNNNAHSFENPTEIQAYPYSISLAASDFSGDGNTDLAILTESFISPFYLGNGLGGFTRSDEKSRLFKSTGRYLEAHDLDNDNVPDLIVTGTGTVSLYLNNGKLSFERISFSMDNEFIGRYITACDLDANGFRDIIFTDYSHGKLYVIWNSGNRVFSQPELIFEAKHQTMSAAVPVKLNGENLPGLCVALESSGTIIMLRNTGDRKYQEAVRTSTQPMPYHLTVADMNADGIDDIVVTHIAKYSNEKGKVTILFGPFPSPTPSMTSFPATAGFPMVATAVDWDMDGYKDLFLTNYDTNSVTFIHSPGKK